MNANGTGTLVLEQYKSEIMSWRLVPERRKHEVRSFHYHIVVPVMKHDKAEITKAAKLHLKLGKNIFYDKVQFVTGTDEAVFLWMACLLPEEENTRELFDDAHRIMEECLVVLEAVTIERRKATAA